MTIWYRVFGAGHVEPTPGALLERLNQLAAVSGRFSGDDAGWFGAELVVAESVTLQVERFLSTEEGVRAELNSWAAHLETLGDGPEYTLLMERMIQTYQMFTVGVSATAGDGVCVALCRFLAETTDGVYQIDGRGFFAADGTLLAKDE
jgi:hypothetical protein